MYRLIVLSAACLFVGVYCVCPIANTGEFTECMEHGLSNIEKTQALKRHNFWRSKIAQRKIKSQPKAGNMLRMRWDTNLAMSAQYIVNTCVFTNRTTKYNNRTDIGQNVHTLVSSSWTPGADWKEAIDAWFNEEKYFTYPDKTAEGQTTGNYTQLVWAKTYNVGCGYTAWYDGKTTYTKLYVCNYGPEGNVAGEAPYKKGRGCYFLCKPKK